MSLGVCPVPIALILVLAAGAAAATGDEGQPVPESRAGASFFVSHDASELYTSIVTIVEPGGPDLGPSLAGAPLPDGALQQVLLRSADGAAYVEITRWSRGRLPSEYVPAYVPAARAYWRHDFSPVGTAGSSFEIDAGSHVQWSQFLLRDAGDHDALLQLVEPMVGTMAAGGAPTLEAIATLTSTHETSIALFGKWETAEGFEIFREDGTFGASPYWAPFADNAHWMLTPVAFK